MCYALSAEANLHIWRFGTVRQFSILMLLILAACAIHAQLVGTGNIQGTVADATGAVVANATVTLADTSSGVNHVTQTDGAGVYESV